MLLILLQHMPILELHTHQPQIITNPCTGEILGLSPQFGTQLREKTGKEIGPKVMNVWDIVDSTQENADALLKATLETRAIIRKLDTDQGASFTPARCLITVNKIPITLEFTPQSKFREVDGKKTKSLTIDIRDASEVDTLTKMHNDKTAFDLITNLFITEAARDQKRRFDEGQPESNVTRIMMDLDHFKSVNDTYGHPAGDEVLIDTARVLTRINRRTDPLIRYGGEEFAMLMKDTSPAQTIQILERVRSALDSTVAHKNQHIRRSVSIGAMIHTPGYDDDKSAEDLYHLSDNMLYESKRNGRNGITIQIQFPYLMWTTFTRLDTGKFKVTQITKPGEEREIQTETFLINSISKFDITKVEIPEDNPFSYDQHTPDFITIFFPHTLQ